MSSEDKYASLGVSSSKDGLHKALEASGVADQSGLFASVIDDLAGDDSFNSFIHCDGAGTKTIVPYLYFKETGDNSLFAGLAQDALVMNLDDIYCIGAPQSMVLANAIARNANVIDDNILEVLITSYKNLCKQYQNEGIPLTLSGGETADCGDVVRTLVVDAVVSGRIAKSNIVNANNIVPDDVIVGLSSTGTAKGESRNNYGTGSNGLTLARHCLIKSDYMEKYPEIVDPKVDKKYAYQGPFSITDKPEGWEHSIGEALASPTRSYAPYLAKLYSDSFSDIPFEDIHGVIHCTGGGLTKVLRFGRANRYVKNNLFETPPLFSLIQEHGKVDWKEMYRVFNMGQRLEVYLPESRADKAIELAKEFEIDAQVIGRVEKQDDPKNSLMVTSEHGTFHY